MLILRKNNVVSFFAYYNPFEVIEGVVKAFSIESHRLFYSLSEIEKHSYFCALIN
ncbi:MAG: hypothetical protein H6Q17_1404 [Bacteroidetes bacterium]|nr:hypothetical protein [Bacteroidota bacterium]